MKTTRTDKNCGNCKHREVYHLKLPCCSCYFEKKIHPIRWELEEEKE